MAQDKVSLTVEAAAGTEIHVHYKGDIGVEDSAQTVYKEKIPSEGRLAKQVPRGNFIVRAPGYEMGFADFSKSTAPLTVKLKKIAGK